MNNILELKGNRFIQASKINTGGGLSMNGYYPVSCSHLNRLKAQLEDIKDFWNYEQRPFSGLIISVNYNKIVAKSNRISWLFKGRQSNQAIVGAKFNQAKNKHIITYYLDPEDLNDTIDLISKAERILADKFDSIMDQNKFKDKEAIKSKDFAGLPLTMTKFKGVISDSSYIDSFEVEEPGLELKSSIVTLYDVKQDPKELLNMLGIDLISTRIIDKQTVYLDDIQIRTLSDRAPYLVSMATVDLTELTPEDFIKSESAEIISIPPPTTEPTIGVIDKLFSEEVYFSDWVEVEDLVDKEIPRTAEDYWHGTAVSSIIVDGPRLNPWLDDGCGRFKVKHFGVAVGREFSSFNILKQIRYAVRSNPDIKVWNISLGSNQEINDNFISAEAAMLDRIQFENDVIFVIAGTNKPSEDINKIGSPADSINSLVVNSVSKSGASADYSRQGIVLSFFSKPDVSYYGGSKEKYITVCQPLGEAKVAGTSYAAPWIARKLSYLIDIIGLNKEVAKALIIDSARGWNEFPTPEDLALYGHGIVPIRIEDIIKSQKDEIKFIVSDVSEKWNTYNYNFPVPMKDDKYPYIARATMCYFPLCERSQGVDYTNTELNLHFGRIGDDNVIKDIKGDKQNQDYQIGDKLHYLLESQARSQFRKWDNVKYIVENSQKRARPKISYSNKNWGMEVKTSNRLDPQDGVGIRFGVVVTLKEINGVNRIDEFQRNCLMNGWLAPEIDVENRIRLYHSVNQDLELS